MKVVFIFGGMPHYLVSLLNKIVEKGVETTVILPEGISKTIGKGVKQVDFNQKFKILYTQEYKTILGKYYFKNLYKLIRNENTNIVVVGWPYIVNLIFDFKLLRYIKKKKVKLFYREIPFMISPKNEIFSYYKQHPIINENLINETPKGIIYYLWIIVLLFLRTRTYRKVDATISYSTKAKEIQKSYGVSEERIFISYNSPDTDSLFKSKERLLKSAEKIEYNPYRLIHVGRLVKWKRVDLIINVLPDLIKRFPETELIVIGDGPEEQNLKELATKLNLKEKVKFFGGIYNYDDLGKYLLSSGIYVLAGMGGLSINEAMAFGKPIICSVCDGTEIDLVTDGKNGSVFKDGDKASLLKCIENLFLNPEKMKEMGNISEEIIKNKINIETVTENFIKAFKSMVSINK